MRGRLRDKLRYGCVLHALAAAGLRRAQRGHGLDRLPGPAPGLRALAGLPARANGTTAPSGRACAGASWPCAPRTTRDLTIHHIRGEARADRRAPCCSQHGTGVRANLFYGSPMRALDRRRRSSRRATTSGSGNWRGSIDLPECDYTLDEVARYDHPALIAAVLRETGAQTLKAIVHCQGSTSFALACAGGLVPEVTDVVSNAVSLPRRRPAAVQAAAAGARAAARGRLHGLRPAVDDAPDRRCARGCWPPGRAPCGASAASPCARWPTTPTASAATSSGTTRTSTRPRTAGSPASSAGCRPRSSSQMARCATAGHLRRGLRLRRAARRRRGRRRRATGRAGRSWRARPTAASCRAARSARSRGSTAWSPGATRSWSSPATRTSTSSSAATPSATCSGTSSSALRGTSNPQGS